MRQACPITINPDSVNKRPADTSKIYRKPKLLDRIREALRSRHYSRHTEQTYCHWVRRFIFFHKGRHHVHETILQRAVKESVRNADIVKHVGFENNINQIAQQLYSADGEKHVGADTAG